MKKVFTKGLSLLAVLVFALSLSIPAAAADVYASDHLSQYDATVFAKGNGVIKISFSVVGTRVLDEIGCRQIVVQKQVNGVWITVKTYDNTYNPELSTTNNYAYANYVLYQGESGVNYRAELTIFGNTDSRIIMTSPERA